MSAFISSVAWTPGTDQVPHRQLQDHTAVGNDRYNGMVDCFKKIIKHEGCAPRVIDDNPNPALIDTPRFSRLYRGISAPILMEAPKR